MQEQEYNNNINAYQFEKQDWQPINNMQFFYSLMKQKKPEVVAYMKQYAHIITKIELNLTDRNFPQCRVEYVTDVTMEQAMLSTFEIVELCAYALNEVNHNTDDIKVVCHMVIISLAEEFGKHKAIIEKNSTFNFKLISKIKESLFKLRNKVVPINSHPNGYNSLMTKLIFKMMLRQFIVTFSVKKSVDATRAH